MGNWGKVEYICTTKLGINMLVLDQLEQWRIEQLLENYRADVEEQKREQEKQAKEQEKQMSSSGAATKQPKLPNMSIPKLSVPKI